MSTSQVYLKRNRRGSPSKARKQPEGTKRGPRGGKKGHVVVKDATSPSIEKYLKPQAPSSPVKDKKDLSLKEEGVRLTTTGCEQGTQSESKSTEVNKKVILEQRDSDELKPQAKHIKNEDTRVRQREGTDQGAGMSKASTTKVVATVAQPRSSKAPVKKEERVAGDDDSGKKSKSGPRRRKKANTTRQSDGDFVPSSSQRRQPVQQSIRDHFPVRRSTRKPKTIIESEKYEEIADKLLSQDESGLRVVEVEGKGRGVVSTRYFSRGELICEYSGELISYEEAKTREELYSKDESVGCYMYYFEHKGTKLCVDATKDNGRMGRLLNHSKTQANVVTKLYEVKDHPYLCLIAARDIKSGEELQYDYGERSKAVIESHPWLAA